MKVAIGIVLGVALTIASLVLYAGMRSRQNVEAANAAAVPVRTIALPDPTPAYGWTDSPASSSIQVFDPGRAIVSGPLPARQGDRDAVIRMRVNIAAKSPVNFALAPAIWRDDLISNFTATSQNEIFTCMRQNVLQATIECDLPLGPPMVWVAWDGRPVASPADTLVRGAFAHFTGVKQPLEEQMARNDVSLRFASYGCIRNCQ